MDIEEVERRAEIRKRTRELADVKSLFDVDSKGKVDPRLRQPYDDYLSLKIDFDTFLKNYAAAVNDVFVKNPSQEFLKDEDFSQYEQEMSLKPDEAARLFAQK